MPTLIELASKIVSKHASKTVMTQEQLLQDLHQVHAALKAIEEGQVIQPAPEQAVEEQKVPALTIRQAFKKDEVLCMICGKGFTTLKRHLAIAHDLTPGQYRKQFGIKSTQKLAAKSYSEARREAAEARGMKDILAKARETRKANIEAKKNLPVAKKKAGVPVVRKRAPVPV